MDVTGRAVIVTGAGSDGCGRAIATRFAREGAAVVVNDIDEDGANETARVIIADGGRAMTARSRIGSDEGARELMELAVRTYGSPAVVVNNASEAYHPDDPLEFWREIIETDLLGVVCLTRRAIEAMRDDGRGGAIVNMSSISALPFGGIRTSAVPAYDAAKAGVMRLTTNLAGLAATDRIRVNCLVPGWMAS
jgi:NAD(P)-dependent dehydrogenase (short-subunit alcohol dehydrogenase family)